MLRSSCTAMVLLFLSLAKVDAQDQRLTLLSDSLAAVRSHPEQHEATRGATIQFDQIKHQLRDWIEARLVALPKDTDEKALTLQMNDDLRRAGLFQLSTSNPQAYDF